MALPRISSWKSSNPNIVNFIEIRTLEMGKKSKGVGLCLAYNEAKIEDCIKSVLWADEVVLIDSHSNDSNSNRRGVRRQSGSGRL